MTEAVALLGFAVVFVFVLQRCGIIGGVHSGDDHHG